MINQFFKYICIPTNSNSDSNTTPSTENQKGLAKVLVEDLHKIGLEAMYDDKYCYVYGILRGNPNYPKLGFLAHMYTSEDASDRNVHPQVIKNYDGKEIRLNEEMVLDSNIYPDLLNHIGKTLITTDGNTHLGADDKAGIVEIMNMLKTIKKDNQNHGDIYVCFTPDEEIGLGVEHIDLSIFKPDFAYTVDGCSLGEISYQNFNAATAKIKIEGKDIHTGMAKNIMINAANIATEINSLIPNELPSNTCGYEGFYHLQRLNANVSEATMSYLIRDFDMETFSKKKDLINSIILLLNKKYGNCIELDIKDTYYNMEKIINDEMHLINNVIEVYKENDIEPIVEPVRGGTDGAELSYKGIPCPNIGTGGHNFHSEYEYIALEDMEKVKDVLINIVYKYAKTLDEIKNNGGKTRK